MKKKEIKEGGFFVGKSDSFQKGIYPGLSRTIDTGGQNGVYVAGGDKVKYMGVAVNPLSKKLEHNGYKDTVCPALLATDHKCPKTVLFCNGDAEMEDIKLQQVASLDRYKNDQMNRVYSSDGLSPTVETVSGGGREPKVQIEPICINAKNDGKQPSMQNRIYSDEGISVAQCAEQGGRYNILSGAIIRKLTPKECWRLMGFTDDDFDKAQASGTSNSQLYKQAGNSIVVNVLEAIFREMF